MAAPGLGEVFLQSEIVCDLAGGCIGIRTDLQVQVIVSKIRERVQARKFEGSSADVVGKAPEGNAHLILQGGGEIVKFGN